jgi:hypothetical protein
MVTTQFNIRLSRDLIYDLEFISESLKVSRNDWLKVKLAELVSHEKNKIIRDAEYRFIGGRISTEEFKKLTGVKPPQELLETKKNTGVAVKKYMTQMIEDNKF